MDRVLGTHKPPYQARNLHLQYYQPYADAARPVILDRLLLEAAHKEHLPEIQVTEPGWEQRYQKAIAEFGAVDVVCPAMERQSLSAALARIPGLPVDRDVLRIYGDVSGVVRYSGEFRVRIELREALQ